MIALFLCLGILQAPSVPTPAFVSTPASAIVVEGRGSPTFSIPRIDEQAVVDGRFDEPAWSKATRRTGFSEYQPADGRPASERTEVWLWYSPKALHIGIVAYDSVPGSVRATVAERDNIERDDSVRIEGSLVSPRISRDRDGSEFARVAIPRLKLEYQPRRSLFFRFITEYGSERRAALEDPVTGAPIYVDGSLAGPLSTNDVRMDWLVSFEPTPGTVAFFGYGSRLARNPDLDNEPGYRRTSDGFFVKLAYMFRR